MSTFVYIMANESLKHIHVGYTHDLAKMMTFYGIIPVSKRAEQRLNMLIYVEEYTDLEMAKLRFEEMNSVPHREKLALARTVNPDLIELIPGINFELT